MTVTEPDFLARLAVHFRYFARSECDRTAPLYAALSIRAAGDPEILGLLAHAAPREARPTLLFAAVHFLVLAEPASELASFYPSVTGRPVPAGDAYPVFRQFCLDRHDELVALLSTRMTQTNEVNRCVALRAALGAAVADLPDQPVALLEVGTSAGLNLGFDRYELPGRFGPAGSPVQLDCDVLGAIAPPFEPALPPLSWRAGLDRSPIRVADDAEIRWLEACLWPEQVERVARFRAAVALARADPPTLVTGDMVDDLARAASTALADAHLVLWHSWVMTYLPRERRPDFAAAVADLAAGGRSVTWLSAEGPGVLDDLAAPPLDADASDELRVATLLGIQRFRRGAAGDRVLLGRCHPHLRWLEWLRPA